MQILASIKKLAQGALNTSHQFDICMNKQIKSYPCKQDVVCYATL